MAACPSAPNAFASRRLQAAKSSSPTILQATTPSWQVHHIINRNQSYCSPTSQNDLSAFANYKASFCPLLKTSRQTPSLCLTFKRPDLLSVALAVRLSARRSRARDKRNRE